jgi:hypothetical protein
MADFGCSLYVLRMGKKYSIEVNSAEGTLTTRGAFFMLVTARNLLNALLGILVIFVNSFLIFLNLS